MAAVSETAVTIGKGSDVEAAEKGCFLKPNLPECTGGCAVKGALLTDFTEVEAPMALAILSRDSGNFVRADILETATLGRGVSQVVNGQRFLKAIARMEAHPIIGGAISHFGERRYRQYEFDREALFTACHNQQLHLVDYGKAEVETSKVTPAKTQKTKVRSRLSSDETVPILRAAVNLFKQFIASGERDSTQMSTILSNEDKALIINSILRAQNEVLHDPAYVDDSGMQERLAKTADLIRILQGKKSASLPLQPTQTKSKTISTENSPAADEGEELSWFDYGNCNGVHPDLFFPERGASTREAKEVCRGCVVREECLEYALTNGEKFGIWGGMSERERRRIRRQRAIARRAAKQATQAAAS